MPVESLFEFQYPTAFVIRVVEYAGDAVHVEASRLGTVDAQAEHSFVDQQGGSLVCPVFGESAGFDFLPVLKHRDSGIVVVPVVRVSLTVASSRRGEMESYTVSARV